MKKFTEHVVTSMDAGRRLDRIVRIMLPNLPLSGIYKAMRQGRILLEDKKSKPQILVTEGQKISIDETLSHELTKSTPSLSKMPMPPILYEDKDILIVDKPAGALVYGEKDALNSIVLAYLAGRTLPSLSFRPGPLHRLDRDTSGILCFSKSLYGSRQFSASLQARSCKKFYLALLDGVSKREDHWNDKILYDKTKHKASVDEQGQESITHLFRLACDGRVSLVLFRIETGRTHQIRAQSAAHALPLVGDATYGKVAKDKYFLHAWALKLPHKTFSLPLIMAPLSVEQRSFLEYYFSNETVGEALQIAEKWVKKSDYGK